MKLHLPTSLRGALIACMTIGCNAYAADYTIGAYTSGQIKATPAAGGNAVALETLTSNDTITFTANATGWTDFGKNINAALNLGDYDFIINDGSGGKHTTYTNTITGTANAVMGRNNSGTPTGQHFEFSGEVKDYYGAFSYGNKSADVTFSKTAANGTPSVINASSIAVARTLTFSTAYTINSTTVNTNTLNVNDNISFTGAVTVGAGGLHITTGKTATFNSGSSLTGTQNGGGTVAMNGGTLGTFTLNDGTLDLGTVSDGVFTTLTGTGNITLTNGALMLNDYDTLAAGNTYTLLSTTGTLTLADAVTFAGHNLDETGNFYYTVGSNRYVGTVLVSGGNSLTLNLAAYNGQNLTWNGGNGTWSAGGTGWSGEAGTFAEHDTVTFADNDAAETITISGTVSPATMTVNGNYVFTPENAESGLEGSGSILINGTATIEGTHAHWLGTTEVASGGTLSLTPASNLLNDLTVNNGGKLNIDVDANTTSTSLPLKGEGEVNISIASGSTWTIAHAKVNNATAADDLSGSDFRGNIVVSGGGTLQLGNQVAGTTLTGLTISGNVFGTTGTITLHDSQTTLKLNSTQTGSAEFNKVIVLGDGTKVVIPDGNYSLKSIQLEKNASAALSYNYGKTLTIKNLTSVTDENDAPTGTFTITHGNTGGVLKITDSLSVGTLTLNNANATATISADNAQVGTLNATTGTALNITGNDADIGTLNTAIDTTISGDNAEIDTLTVTGGTTTISKATGSIGALSVSNATVKLTKDSGAYNVTSVDIGNGGTLHVGEGSGYNASLNCSDITINGGGTLAFLNGPSGTIGVEDGTITIANADTTAAVIKGTYDGTTVIKSDITGSGVLEFQQNGSYTNPVKITGEVSGAELSLKQTSGTYVLSASNSYGGTTSIEGGQMTLENTKALGNSSATTVSTGATLSVGSDVNELNLGADDHTITISSGATLKTDHAVALTGSLTLNAGATLDLSGFSFSSSTFATSSATALMTATGDISVGNITVSSTPEGSFLGLNSIADGTDTLYALTALGITGVNGYDAATHTLTFTTNLDVTHLYGDVTCELDGKTWGEIGTKVYTLVGDWSTMLNLSFLAADGTTLINLNGVTGLTLNDYSGEGELTHVGDTAVGTYAAYMIPEPTTATLSLLALAGLAARRRRK